MRRTIPVALIPIVRNVPFPRMDVIGVNSMINVMPKEVSMAVRSVWIVIPMIDVNDDIQSGSPHRGVLVP